MASVCWKFVSRSMDIWPTTFVNISWPPKVILKVLSRWKGQKTHSRGKILPLSRALVPTILNQWPRNFGFKLSTYKTWLNINGSLTRSYFFNGKIEDYQKNLHFHNRHYINHYINSIRIISQRAKCRILKLGDMVVLCWNLNMAKPLFLGQLKNCRYPSREVWIVFMGTERIFASGDRGEA